ncbi:MAG: hypothetical protein JW953_24215 [Anaerolineae bacterium]|nr:hypothetical protein [Anaerolineae bacterium]
MPDLSIHPVYLSARAAIVAPEKAIPVTLYSVQKWLSRLGPERWCLVMLLRSLSIDGPRRSDGTKRVTCSWRELAELLDVHEETVASWLKHQPIPHDKPWRRIIPGDEKSKYLALFIPRLRYAYETHNGKTRRTGFMLEVLMEDPVAPEDEAKLQQRIEILQMQQGELGLETYRLENVKGRDADLPQISGEKMSPQNTDLHYVNQLNSDSLLSANPLQLGLHNTKVNQENLGLQTNVKQQNMGSDSYVNLPIVDLHNTESEESGKNVNELDILIQQHKRNNSKNPRRTSLEPIVRLTEALLEDDHSTAMFYKVLQALYPERLDLYVAAVRVAVQAAEAEPEVNAGAVFVRALRDFADVAGVGLGLKPAAEENVNHKTGEWLGAEVPKISEASFVLPSVDEAIWSETQSMLRRQMTQATYNAVIQGTELVGHEKGVYIIGVQTEMAKEWLDNRLRDIVQRALSSVVGKQVQIEFKLVTRDSS